VSKYLEKYDLSQALKSTKLNKKWKKERTFEV
jgi:hypothetical protein